MTGAELSETRRKLHMNAAALGRALQLTGRDPGRLIRHWESGVAKVPGPVAVAVGYMLKERQDAARAERAAAAQARAAEALAPAPPIPEPAPAPEPVAPSVAVRDRPPLKTRRRG